MKGSEVRLRERGSYRPTKTLKASYKPHCAPVNVPIITILRGSPLVNSPKSPIFFTACNNISLHQNFNVLATVLNIDLHLQRLLP